MTTKSKLDPRVEDVSVRDVLRRAAARAILAPSVHNSQPWQFRLGTDHLDLLADPGRQLQVLDPLGRQLTISCGCALFNTRAAVAAEGLDATVVRLPDPDQPELLARVTVTPASAPDGATLAALDLYADRPVAVLVGGHDRGLPWDEFADAMRTRAPRAIVTMGQNGPRIHALLEHVAAQAGFALEAARDLAEAVDKARAALPGGGVVLLSPGAPSFGPYRNYVARGRHFAGLAGFSLAAGFAGASGAAAGWATA